MSRRSFLRAAGVAAAGLLPAVCRLQESAEAESTSRTAAKVASRATVTAASAVATAVMGFDPTAAPIRTVAILEEG